MNRKNADNGGDCVECDVGRYANMSADICVDCAPGRSQESTGQDACEVCDSGKYQDKPKQAYCEKCTGQTFTDDTVAIKTSCQLCPAGYEVENVDTSAATGPSNCRKCIPGQFNSAPGQECGQCPMGFRTFHDSTVCDSCRAGRYQDSPGAVTCRDCLQGRFNDVAGSSSCSHCPRGQMQPNAGQDFCTPPDIGKIVADGQSYAVDISEGWYGTDCLSGATLCQSIARCMAGTVGRKNRTGCDKCAPGMWSSAGAMPPCKQCDPGKFAENEGSPACKKCKDSATRPRGYSDEVGQYACKTCKDSEYSTGINGDGCAPITANPNLPVPDAAGPVRVAGNDQMMRLEWHIEGDKWCKAWQDENTCTRPLIASFDMRVSTEKEGCDNCSKAYALDRLAQPILTRDKDETLVKTTWSMDIPVDSPMCQTVQYVAVRVVAADSTGNTGASQYGKWSERTDTWKSLGKKSCGDESKYLDCQTSDNPADWTCEDCPVGAYCGDGGDAVDQNGVKAKGWINKATTACEECEPYPSKPSVQSTYWRDDRAASADDSEWQVPFKYKFVKCPNPLACNGSDVTEMCNEAMGYLDQCCLNGTGVAGKNASGFAACGRCRLCQTCKSGYSMEADGVTCAPCGENPSAIMAGSFFIFLIIVLVYGALVFLKIRGSTRADKLTKRPTRPSSASS